MFLCVTLRIMTLDTYIKAARLTEKQVAIAIAISRSFVSHLRNGQRRPSIQVAKRIEDWSHGAVPASSFA